MTRLSKCQIMLKFSIMTDQKKYQKVQVCVFCKDEVLLLKVAKERGGFWQNVTGSVEDGENFEEGAIRELEEETGILTKVFSADYEFQFFSQYQNVVIEKAFYCFLSQKPELILSEEHEEYKWIKINEVTSLDFQYPSNYEAFIRSSEKLKA